MRKGRHIPGLSIDSLGVLATSVGGDAFEVVTNTLRKSESRWILLIECAEKGGKHSTARLLWLLNGDRPLRNTDIAEPRLVQLRRIMLEWWVKTGEME